MRGNILFYTVVLLLGYLSVEELGVEAVYVDDGWGNKGCVFESGKFANYVNKQYDDWVKAKDITQCIALCTTRHNADEAINSIGMWDDGDPGCYCIKGEGGFHSESKYKSCYLPLSSIRSRDDKIAKWGELTSTVETEFGSPTKLENGCYWFPYNWYTSDTPAEIFQKMYLYKEFYDFFATFGNNMITYRTSRFTTNILFSPACNLIKFMIGYGPMDIKKQPFDFMTINQITAVQFNVDQMASGKLVFTASAIVRVTKSSSIFRSGEFEVLIECTNGADVVLKIATGKEVSAMDFLAFLDIQRGDISKKFRTEDQIEYLRFRSATISFALSGEPDLYAAYIEGTSTNDREYRKLDKFTLFCMVDMVEGTHCALIGKLPFASYETELYSALGRGRGSDSLYAKFKLAPKQIDFVVFQSSLKPIPDISALTWYDDIKNTIVSERTKTKSDSDNEIVEDGIIGKRCLRYKRNEMNSWNSLMWKKAMVVLEFTGHSITSPADVKLYAPELTATKNVKALLTSFFSGFSGFQESKFNTWATSIAGYTKMQFEYVEIRDNNIIFIMKPKIVKNIVDYPDQGLHLVPNVKYTRIQDASIGVKVNQKSTRLEFTLDSVGKDSILGSEVDVILKGRPGAEIEEWLTIDFKNIPNSQLLLKSLLDMKNTAKGSNNEVASNGALKKPFPSLNNLAFSSLKLETELTTTVNYIAFTADNVVLGDISGAKYQLTVDKSNFETSTCFYTNTPGKMKTAFDAVQQKTFFDQTWFRYSGIGFVVSPQKIRNLDNSGESLCYYEHTSYAFSKEIEGTTLTVDEPARSQNAIAVTIQDFWIDDCAMEVEEEYPDGTKGIVTSVSKACLYLRRFFVEISDEKISTTMTGWMDNTKLHVGGTLSIDEDKKAHILDDGVEMYTRPTTMSIKVDNDPANPSLILQIEGRISLSTGIMINVIMKINEDIVNYEFGHSEYLLRFTRRKMDTAGAPFFAYASARYLPIIVPYDEDISDPGIRCKFKNGKKMVGTNSELNTDWGARWSYEGCMRECLQKKERLNYNYIGMSFTSGSCSCLLGSIRTTRSKREFTSCSFDTVEPPERPVLADPGLKLIQISAKTKLALEGGAHDPATYIYFDKKDLNRAYLSTTKKLYDSQFYACKECTKRVSFGRLLNLFNINTVVIDLFKNSYIQGLCFISNTGGSPWNIESFDRTFPEGMTITGVLETDLNTGGQKYDLPIETKQNTKSFEICVRLPVLKYGDRSVPARTAWPMEETLEIGDELTNDGITTEEKSPTIVVDDMKCAFKKGEPDRRLQITEQSGISTHKECVKKCVSLAKTDPGYDGVAIHHQDQRFRCFCTKQVASLRQTSGWESCDLEEFVEPLVEISGGETENAEKVGPKLCFKSSKTKKEMYMVGRLETFLFVEENARFEFKIASGMVKMEFKGAKRRNLPGNINAEVTLDAEVTDGIFNTKFQFKIANILPSALQTSAAESIFNQVRDAAAEKINVYQKAYKEKVDAFGKKIDLFERKNRVFNKKMEKAKRDLHVAQIKRAEMSNAMKNDCSESCGYVHIPGWKVDNKCSDAKSMRCMKYKRSADYASNVNCIAKCEVERVKAKSEIAHLYGRQLRLAGNADWMRSCKEKGVALIDRMKEIKGTYTTDTNDMNWAYNNILRLNFRRYGITLMSFPASGFQHLDRQRLKDPSCLAFSWTYDKVITDKPLCFEKFFETIAKDSFDSVSNMDGIKANWPTYQERKSELKVLLKWDRGNDLARELQLLEEPWEACNEQMKTKRDVIEVGETTSSVPDFQMADQYEYEEDSEEALGKESPWVVAKKRDALAELSTKTFNVPLKNITQVSNDTACSSAKRATIDYYNIAKYMQTWTQEQKSAKHALDALKNSVQRDMVSYTKLTNSSYNDDDLSSADKDMVAYWMDKAKTGMEEYMNFEDNQLSRYNQEGLPLIRKELESAYTDDNHKTLSDYFAHRSVDGTDAFKRANINTAPGFPDLSKTLIDTLESGKSLEEISSTIDNLVLNTAVLHKRSLEC